VRKVSDDFPFRRYWWKHCGVTGERRSASHRGYLQTERESRSTLTASETGYFYRSLKKAELPHTTLRSLRHVAITILIEHGVSTKVAQERLGHTTMRMTADTYAHISPNAQIEATRKVQELFGENERKMGVKQR
jgi:integrase